MPITHAKVSAIADSVAAALVQPSEWNAAHVIGALGTPAADGIVFPATQVPSAGANTLDDYEEGVWTPVLTFQTPGDLSVAYARQTGRYTKVGRMVFVTIDISTSTFTFTTASGELRITGLPFTAAALAGGYPGVVGMRVPTPPTGAIGYMLGVVNGNTECQVIASKSSGAVAALTVANMTTAIITDIRASGLYHV